jgi:hypothetical protein
MVIAALCPHFGLLLAAPDGHNRAERPKEGLPMPGFDVFLSHKSSDKPAVRALKRALAEQGLRCWLDEEQLRPGLPWQDLLEQGIKGSGSVAVCVAADGLGP